MPCFELLRKAVASAHFMVLKQTELTLFFCNKLQRSIATLVILDPFFIALSIIRQTFPVSWMSNQQALTVSETFTTRNGLPELDMHYYLHALIVVKDVVCWFDDFHCIVQKFCYSYYYSNSSLVLVAYEPFG